MAAQDYVLGLLMNGVALAAGVFVPEIVVALDLFGDQLHVNLVENPPEVQQLCILCCSASHAW